MTSPSRRKEVAVQRRSTLIEAGAAEPAQLPGGGLDPAERSRRIAEAAYYRAQRRGFCPGCELEDWLEAEHEIDEQSRPGDAAHGTAQ